MGEILRRQQPGSALTQGSSWISASIPTPWGRRPRLSACCRSPRPWPPCYPEPDCGTLRSAAAAFYGVDPDQVIAANGAVELIYLLAQVLHPRTVLIPGPTFKEYEIACRLQGAVVKHFHLSPRQGFLPHLPQLIRADPGSRPGLALQPQQPYRQPGAAGGTAAVPGALPGARDLSGRRRILFVVSS